MGGIYRPEALEQFEDILEYGSFHDAIIETLGYGISQKEGGPVQRMEELKPFQHQSMILQD